MIGRLRALVRIALLALPGICLLPWQSSAQVAPPGNVQFNEVQIAADAFSLGEPVPTWIAPITLPEPAQSEPMQLRLADTQYLVGQKPVVYVRRALLINDAASLSSAGQVSIPFVPQYHQLKVHAVRVLRAGESLDRTSSSTVRFLQREIGLERGVYSGEVTASILVSDVRVGDTLEYSYSLFGQNPVFGSRFFATASWDQGFPTALRRVVLNHPVGRRVSWRLIGDRQPAPMTPGESVHDGMRRLVFEQRSMAKVNVEPLTPPDYVPYRGLQFSEFASWGEVVGWAGELFQSNKEPSDDVRAVVETLRKKTTEEDRVVAALEFVQSEIRYFSVSMGESSHRPTQPDVVLKRRYGDCKDKSLLLLTLLQALGIPAKPVLVDFGRLKGIDAALPSPELFNHVIVQTTVGGQAFYLDPTWLGQHSRLRRMGQLHEGAQVLVVAPETRELTAIHSANRYELARAIVSETATIQKFSADGQLQSKRIWHGVVAERLRIMHAQMPREQLLKSIADAMESRYPGAKLIGEPDIQDDRVNNAVSIAATYTVPKLATEREGNWFVRYLPANMRGTLVAPPSAARTAPMQLAYFPYEARYTFEVKFPDEVSVMADPRAQTVDNKHFKLTRSASFRGNVAKQTIELRMLAGKVEVADLQKYAEDSRTAANLAVGAIVVPKSAIKAVASSAKGKKKDFAQTLRDQVQETVDKTSQAIKSGKLAGADLANSYCLRSGAYASLGTPDKAIADADEAVKLTPNSPTSLYCRAHIYFQAGEFEKSVADYSKAIALGDTEPRTVHQRGISKFYAGKLEDAAEDFAKATDTGDKEAQVYSDLWLSWTHLRLGKAVPDAVVKRAAEEPQGGWPRPARAVLAGNLTPEEMLKLIDRKTGDERTMASSEGYFYLGQYYLGRGDKAKARELFEKARRLNIILYTEHTAAGFELRQLEASARVPTTTSSIGSSAPDTPNTPVQNAAPAPPPAAKKAGTKAPAKKPDSWTRDVWKQ